MSETNTEGVDGTQEAEGEPEWVLASREAAAGAGHEGEDGDEAAEPIPAKKLMNDAGGTTMEVSLCVQYMIRLADWPMRWGTQWRRVCVRRGNRQHENEESTRCVLTAHMSVRPRSNR